MGLIDHLRKLEDSPHSYDPGYINEYFARCRTVLLTIGNDARIHNIPSLYLVLSQNNNIKFFSDTRKNAIQRKHLLISTIDILVKAELLMKEELKTESGRYEKPINYMYVLLTEKGTRVYEELRYKEERKVRDQKS